MRSCFAALVALAVTTGLMAAGSAQAAVTMGSPLQASSFSDNCASGCTYVQRTLPGRTTVAPYDGIIVRWRARIAGSARLEVAHYTATGTAFRVAISEPIAGLATSQTATASTRLAIRAGDHIGIQRPGPTQILHHTVPGSDADFWIEGGTNTFSTTPEPPDGDGEHAPLFNADVERDADRDGFGDESQDGCPTNGTVQGPCPVAADKTTPVLSVGFSRTVFRAAGSGPSISAKRKPIGTKVSFTLSEPGSVKFTVQRKTRGRKVGRKCVKPKRSNRRKKACTRWATVRGSFTLPGKAGKNEFTFRGRMGGRKLRAGRYRLSSVGTDAAGNSSTVKRRGFRIVR